jgi:stress response protein YsnF
VSDTQNYSARPTVTDRDGVRAEVTGEIHDAKHVVIRQTDGTSLLLPRGGLKEDGPNHYRVSFSFKGLQVLERGTDRGREHGASEVVVPVVHEDVHVEKRVVEGGGVRVHKTVDEREVRVHDSVTVEHVDVQRIKIDQIVESHPRVREEGDLTIIPVVEEVLIVEKRLMLREEIHVRRTRETRTEEQPVTLRQERVEVERLSPREETETRD